MLILRRVLWVLAGLIAVKSLVGLTWPQAGRAVARWWLAMPRLAGRVLGAVCVLLGLALAGLAASQIADATISAGLLMGILLIVVGIIYQAPQVLEMVVQPFLNSQRPWLLRLGGLLGLVLALLLAWCAWR